MNILCICLCVCVRVCGAAECGVQWMGGLLLPRTWLIYLRCWCCPSWVEVGCVWCVCRGYTWVDLVFYMHFTNLLILLSVCVCVCVRMCVWLSLRLLCLLCYWVKLISVLVSVSPFYLHLSWPNTAMMRCTTDWWSSSFHGCSRPRNASLATGRNSFTPVLPGQIVSNDLRIYLAILLAFRFLFLIFVLKNVFFFWVYF